MVAGGVRSEKGVADVGAALDRGVGGCAWVGVRGREGAISSVRMQVPSVFADG